VVDTDGEALRLCGAPKALLRRQVLPQQL